MPVRIQIVPRIGFYAAAAFIGALSLIPAVALPPSEVSDKVEHFLAYAALGLVGGATACNRTRAAWSILGIIAFGIAIELLQVFSPGRYAEVGDALADALGAVIGGGLAIALRRRRGAAGAS